MIGATIFCGISLIAIPGLRHDACGLRIDGKNFYSAVRKINYTDSASRAVEGGVGFKLGSPFFVRPKVGIAHIDHPGALLGGHWQAALYAEFGHTIKNSEWTIGWSHYSNGDTKSPNYGEDYMVLGYGVNF